jgi:CheY-like chemotaxis protein
MSTAARHTILYVEDDLDDLFIVQQAFENYNDTITVVHAHNGFMALEYLNNLYELNALPCLVILDMNMPGMDGRETLIRIKQSELFKEIPVGELNLLQNLLCIMSWKYWPKPSLTNAISR